MAQLDYQVGNETMSDRSPLPAGDYSAMVTESDIKTTQKGGKAVSLTWTIIEPDAFAGRKVWSNLNLVNANPQAVEIAQKELNSIAFACGYAPGTTISDTQMLHEKICTITLKVRPEGKGKDGVFYEAKNEIKSYAPLGGAAPQQQPGGQNAPASVGQQMQRQNPPQQPPQQQYMPPQQNATAHQAPAGSPGKPPWKR